MLSVNSLGFELANRTIFDNINFKLEEGEILQIQGTNGSGKTTLLKIIAGLKSTNTGSVYWKNELISEIREQYHTNLQYIGHFIGIKPNLTVKENLQLAVALANKTIANNFDFTLDLLQLLPYEKTLVRYLSVGQQRRVALAKLVLLSAKLWILDEPFTAIDSEGINIITTVLINHAKEGGIIVFTSHQTFPIQYHLIKSLKLG